jgi:hypothetical protein
MARLEDDRAGLRTRLWEVTAEWAGERAGVWITHRPRRFNGEPWYWAMNDTARGEINVGRWCITTNWQVPFAPRDTDPPPAWALPKKPARPGGSSGRGAGRPGGAEAPSLGGRAKWPSRAAPSGRKQGRAEGPWP